MKTEMQASAVYGIFDFYYFETNYFELTDSDTVKKGYRIRRS